MPESSRARPLTRRSRREAQTAIVCSDLSLARAEGRRASAARVIDGVSFRVARGGSLALMGPTGGGKSSIAAFLSGTEDAGLAVVGGSAAVAGIPVTSKRHRRAIAFTSGFLGQGDAAQLPARLSVGDFVGWPVTARTRRYDAGVLAARIAELLEELQLPPGLAAKHPHELSAGMRQRVALARALVLDPQVLVADELFANLDLDARQAVRAAIMRRRAEYGMATLVVTNEADVVRELDADTLVVHSGHAVAVGRSGEELLWTPDGAVARRELIEGENARPDAPGE